MPVQRGWFRTSLEDFITQFGWGEVLNEWFSFILENWENETVQLYLGVFKKEINSLNLPDDYRVMLNDMLGGKFQGGAAAALSMATGVGSSMAGGLIQPVNKLLGYAVDRKLRSELLPLEAILAAWYRFPDAQSRYREQLEKYGITDVDIGTLLRLSENRLSDGDLIEYWRRFDYSDEFFNRELGRRGYDERSKRQIRALATFNPPIPDVIRFGVREVFDSEVVSRFQLDGNFNNFPLELAKSHGMTEEQALWYWRAHWELPSISIGYEMLHRLRPKRTDYPFTEADMRLLLRTQDISPYWHDRLMAISYLPLRITDIRNLYEYGIIDRTEVVESYQDRGNSPTDSELLADLVVAQSQGTQKDLTRASIQDGYENAILSFNEALSMLMSIGYDENEATYWLVLVENKLAQEQLKEQLDATEYLYINNQIDRNEVIDRLASLNLSTERMLALIELWDVKLAGKLSLPTKAELTDFYENDIINVATFRQQLSMLHWDEQRIAWYIEYTDLQLQIKRQKEAADEIDKRQKTEVSELTEGYEIERAKIDEEIASLRADIADIKVARHHITDEQALADIPVIIDSINADIAELNLRKMKLRSDYREERGDITSG